MFGKRASVPIQAQVRHSSKWPMSIDAVASRISWGRSEGTYRLQVTLASEKDQAMLGGEGYFTTYQ